jgi:hypothetical protein
MALRPQLSTGFAFISINFNGIILPFYEVLVNCEFTNTSVKSGMHSSLKNLLQVHNTSFFLNKLILVHIP